MPFENATREKILTLDRMTRPTGGGSTTTLILPRSGILARLWLRISLTLAGTITSPAPAGVPTALRRVRLSLNNGVDVFNVSGIGYHYLLREMIDSFSDATPQSSRAAVAAGTYDLDMIIPVWFNLRDPLGAIVLQNEQTLATLSIDWAADSELGSGISSSSGFCDTLMQVFEVPLKQDDWPPINVIHAVTEDIVSLPAAGEHTYNWPRGNTYLGCYHLLIGTTYTRAQLRAQQSIFYYQFTPETHRMRYNNVVGRDVNLTGTALTGFGNRVFFDFCGSDGLGTYGTVRDVINSAALTDLATVINTAGSGTLHSVRRQLIYLA